jgi:hypothetical protein
LPWLFPGDLGGFETIARCVVFESRRNAGFDQLGIAFEFALGRVEINLSAINAGLNRDDLLSRGCD